MDLAPFIAAGIYDPASPTAAERLELIEHLVQRFTPEDIIKTSPGGPFFSVAVALTNPVPKYLSAREIADVCGMELGKFMRIRSALGLRVDDVDSLSIPETTIEDMQLFAFAEGQFGTERLVNFIRILGAVTGRLTEAARSLFTSSLTDDQTINVSELQLSQANELSMAAWTSLTVIIGHLMLEYTARSEEFTLALLEGEIQMTVVFVDLVGSTTWALEVSASEHSRALSRFEEAAWDLSVRHGGRVVKLIGDEAMIVAESPDSACRIALELCSFVETDKFLPAATGAVGFGNVTARDGDYFGPLVNLVARATKSAPAGGVVVTEEVARRLSPQSWSMGSPTTVSLRGIEQPVALQVLARQTD